MVAVGDAGGVLVPECGASCFVGGQGFPFYGGKCGTVCCVCVRLGRWFEEHAITDDPHMRGEGTMPGSFGARRSCR